MQHFLKSNKEMESLDEELAREHFSGKTREEAKNLIKSNFNYYVEDLAWMSSALFDQYVLSVTDLAKEELQDFDEESSDCLENIVNMLEGRYILNGNSREEPLKKITELLFLCREFCERTMQTPTFSLLHRQEQRIILSALKKINSLAKSYSIQ